VPLVARYNGKRWRTVIAPVIPQGASALSPTDIWVVGPKPAARPVAPPFAVARWDGHAWHKLNFPHLSLPKGTGLNDASILVISRSSIWVACSLAAGRGVAPGFVLLHLTAHGWNHVHVPFPPGSLTAITRDGRGGPVPTETADTSPDNYILHYFRGHWTRQSAPSPPHFLTEVSAISWAPGARYGWAGGVVLTGGAGQGALLKS
jgi:hypothetical protein